MDNVYLEMHLPYKTGLEGINKEVLRIYYLGYDNLPHIDPADNRHDVVDDALMSILTQVESLDHAFMSPQARYIERHNIKVILQNVYDKGVINGRKIIK